MDLFDSFNPRFAWLVCGYKGILGTQLSPSTLILLEL
jgi:hypothetical protein